MQLNKWIQFLLFCSKISGLGSDPRMETIARQYSTGWGEFILGLAKTRNMFGLSGVVGCQVM